MINITKHEKQFEERLNSLILLKALLIKENAFDEGTQQVYQNAWEEMFDLTKIIQRSGTGCLMPSDVLDTRGHEAANGCFATISAS
ncbi:hypothetical protein J0J80_10575 [Turicibacter bilis]|uniref:hypothetical protein n=1 Tax=Turicibacter bilis TaxID=2735723 RepID=UPI001BAF51BC|nr:hypothetical protein [Turicibacter bilis]MBS3201957.1 hypothetical protein [Turicibacter bilis]UUF10462.1 hypothetical protein J0J80_10575 [Turicibacter bilis]